MIRSVKGMAGRYLVLFLLCLFVTNTASARQKPDRQLQLSTIVVDTASILEHIARGNALSLQNRDSAVSTLGQAIVWSEQAGFVTGIRKGLHLLLPLLNDTGKSRLLDRLQQSCSRSVSLRAALAVIYNAQGKISQLKEQYERAGNYYMMAIPIAQQYMPDYLATVYNNYGSLLFSLPQDSVANNQKSLYYLEKAEQVARKYNDLKIITCVLCNKAKIFRNQKKYSESMRLARMGLQLAREHHFTQWEYVLLNNIGDLYYVMGEPAKAIPYLEEAIRSSNQPVDPYYRNMATFTLGEVYYELGNTRKAEHFFLESLAAAKAFGVGRDLMEANKRLARLYAAGKDYARAYDYQLAYTDINDSIRSKEVMDNVQQLEVRFRTAEKDKELLKSKLHIEQQAQSLHNKNMIIVVSIALVSILLLVFIVVYSRLKQKQKIRARDEQIREMKALMQGEEQERIRLAQDLHDGIGGMLAAVNMNMNVAEKADFANKPELKKIIGMIEQTTDEVRKTAHNLMPSALLRSNLKEALTYYCNHINGSGGLLIDLNVHGALNEINTTSVTIIFRMVQELIQNILKHADATHAVVSLEHMQSTLSLIVEDNGLGFDLREKTMGFGLENLSYRVKGLGGSLDIRSEIGEGTSITVNLPLQHLQ